MLQLYIFLCFGTFPVYSVFYKSNVTDLSKCKVHYSRSGSVYKDFYSISENPDDTNGSYFLDFHLAVMSPSDAHILLAPSVNVEKADPVYEIVIGAGGNTFCDIRRKQKSEVKASVRINGLLSGLDPRFFWVHITKDNVIEVGKEGEELAFISWTDPDLLPVKVFSFSTWSGIEAKWYFDCDRRNIVEEIEKKLTPLEKLRRDLLTGYNPYIRPVYDTSTITEVEMSMVINSLEIDQHKSTIQLKGTTELHWHDEKLNWNPEDHSGLEAIHIFRREIWQPELVLVNSVGDGRDILSDSMMVVRSNGNVEWKTSISMTSWCNAEDTARWPRDTHFCNFVLCFIKDYTTTKLKFNKNESHLQHSETSEWNILEVSFEVGRSKISRPTSFEINLLVGRSSDIYDMIFFTPFLIISIMVLSIFWMSPFGMSKIVLSCVQMIFSTLMLLSLAITIPSHSKDVPYLVVIYSSSLVGGVIAMIVSIVVINISRVGQNIALHHLLCRLLTSKVLKNIFYLPDSRMDDEYGNLDSISRKSFCKNSQTMWILLGMAIDRIAFFFYLALIIYAIFLYAYV